MLTRHGKVLVVTSDPRAPMPLKETLKESLDLARSRKGRVLLIYRLIPLLIGPMDTVDGLMKAWADRDCARPTRQIRPGLELPSDL